MLPNYSDSEKSPLRPDIRGFGFGHRALSYFAALLRAVAGVSRATNRALNAGLRVAYTVIPAPIKAKNIEAIPPSASVSSFQKFIRTSFNAASKAIWFSFITV